MDYAGPTIDIEHLLGGRNDAAAARIRRFLARPDLTRHLGSPVFHVIEAIKRIPTLGGHDNVTFPEIVPVEKNFDLLGTPPDHPSRRPSDTYYVDDANVLRTQTTTMWPYYLRDASVRERLDGEGEVLAISYGKVYRNDEIDRSHYPVFHQVDGLRVCRRSVRTFGVDDLVAVLVEIAQGVYGSGVRWRVADDTFPFTHPSIELQIEWDGQWLEVLGAGLVHTKVLNRLGLDAGEYNGWAFGFGLDRLAMVKMQIPDIRILWSEDERITRQFDDINSTYVPVSMLPCTDRDVSFAVAEGLALNRVYELMRDCGEVDGEDLIEEVKRVDEFRSETKVGAGKVSYSFRIRYRSHVRTLTHAEVNEVQAKLRARVESELGAVLR